MGFSTEPGGIGWMDLTVGDASVVRDFYARVAGWQAVDVPLEEHIDYTMVMNDEAVGGICNAPGVNAALPGAWLIYINVSDLDAAISQARELGGELIDGPRGEPGEPRFAVLRDPGGAAFALMEPQS